MHTDPYRSCSLPTSLTFFLFARLLQPKNIIRLQFSSTLTISIPFSCPMYQAQLSWCFVLCILFLSFHIPFKKLVYWIPKFYTFLWAFLVIPLSVFVVFNFISTGITFFLFLHSFFVIYENELLQCQWRKEWESLWSERDRAHILQIEECILLYHASSCILGIVRISLMVCRKLLYWKYSFMWRQNLTKSSK